MLKQHLLLLFMYLKSHTAGSSEIKLRLYDTEILWIEILTISVAFGISF